MKDPQIRDRKTCKMSGRGIVAGPVLLGTR